MKSIKKVFGASMIVAFFSVVGLTSVSNDAQAACKESGYEDIYCSDTGCGDVGFDTCVSANQ